ncbi:MAG: hypothetical protein JNM27_14520 [Leptospirales bacterium]|nr:hypothetical protein [Leptospirales bacterium]
MQRDNKTIDSNPPEILASPLDRWAAKLHLPWLPPVLLIGLALAVKLSFYFSSEPLTGWDTPGHLHMARTYNELFASFDSIGYDPDWFLGFPAFYFYPPFFYFCVSQIHLLSGRLFPLEFAFNISMLLVLVFFAFAYVRLCLVVFDSRQLTGRFRALMLSALGLVWYLSYPGDGLQGTALVGFLGGTVVGTFAHALILLALYFVEVGRRTKSPVRFLQFVLTASLLAYTHALSTAFFLIVICIYFLFFKASFTWRHIAVMLGGFLILTSPVWLLFARYAAYSSGVSIVTFYPPLLSILGTDFYERIVDQGFSSVLRELFVSFKWLNLTIIVLFILQVGKALLGKVQFGFQLFILTMSLVLIWMAIDTSLAYIFPDPAVHWYRTFDLAWGLGTIVAAGALTLNDASVPERIRFRVDVVLLLLFLISFGRFLAWNPVAHEKYESIRFYSHKQSTQQLETFLQALPRGSTILPEKIRDRNMFGSPHFADYLIEKYGHRNALGLMVESSLAPVSTYGYLMRALPETFVWGIDARKSSMIYANYQNDELPTFLRRNGVQYVLGRSRYLQAYMGAHQKDFRLVFGADGLFVYEVQNPFPQALAWRKGPIGLLTLARIKGGPANSLPPSDFLVIANQVRLRLGQAPPVIHLDPVYGTREFATVAKRLNALVIYNDSRNLAPSGILGTSVIDKPLFLVNFQQTEEGPAARYLYTAIALPSNVMRIPFETLPEHEAVKASMPDQKTIEVFRNARDNAGGNPDRNACFSLNLGYFPDWKSSGHIYQTETNGMLICPESDNATLRFSNTFSKPITVLMYLLTLCLLALGIAGARLEAWAMKALRRLPGSCLEPTE